MYLLAPSILQNFEKILRADPVQSYGMCHFWAQNGRFVLNKLFLVQTIIITFIRLLAIFIVQNLNKFLQQIQSRAIFGPKIVYLHQTKFFLENY